jgi:hypothetical protein
MVRNMVKICTRYLHDADFYNDFHWIAATLKSGEGAIGTTVLRRLPMLNRAGAVLWSRRLRRLRG